MPLDIKEIAKLIRSGHRLGFESMISKNQNYFGDITSGVIFRLDIESEEVNTDSGMIVTELGVSFKVNSLEAVYRLIETLNVQKNGYKDIIQQMHHKANIKPNQDSFTISIRNMKRFI